MFLNYFYNGTASIPRRLKVNEKTSAHRSLKVKSLPMENAVTIKNLNKTYRGGHQALKNLNLEIKQGEIFALLGPNGAGKTSLINIICGLSTKTSGEISVLGKDPVKDFRFTRKKIGLVQQELNHDPFLKIREIIATQGGYYGVKNPEGRALELLATVNLSDKAEMSSRVLSGGMKRRIMIAKALVHDPEIIFLDEPTAGVDIEIRANLWNVVRDLKKRGKTIVLTTHYLEEAEELADRIGFINKGEIVLVEDAKALLARYGAKLNDIYVDIIQNGKVA